MACAECGFDNPAGARFCGRCGALLPRICPTCGTPVAEGHVFCTACGARLEPVLAAEPADERKVVTVLFADLVGFTARAEQLDPEDVRRLLSPYFARLRAELERFGGTVEKFIGDAVMAVFGAPVAHEDDAERAVRAALAIREAIHELNAADPSLQLRLRIGVNTGEAFVSVGARSSEGEGLATGDVVNTASRLETHAAPDCILVGEQTYRATRREIEYRALEAIRAKGKAAPVPVWEAVAQRTPLAGDSIERDTPLIGRQEQLELLLDAVDRARRERLAQLVTLVGAPGIGKSRLVVELTAALEAQAEPVVVLQGRSLPYGEGVTFWALSEMTKARAGIVERDSADAAAGKLHAAVADVVTDEGDLRWVEEHLRPLAGLAAETAPRDDRRSEAFAAWRRYFESLAEQTPLVLVFEDVHWADDGLLDFVDHLVEWATDVPLLVIATTRPDLLERRSDWGGVKGNALTISLAALSPDETTELLRALLEDAVLPETAQDALLARAGGNPLYAAEYVRMLLDRGFLARNGGGGLDMAEELPLPDTVQAIIAARLDALAADEKALVQDAAVLGETFMPAALVSMGARQRPAVDERLLSLERKEFLRRDRRTAAGPEQRYLFRHVLVRDVAYSQIPRARRADKHRLAAEWLESLAVDRSEDQAEMLAYHYSSALRFARAAGVDTAPLVERAGRTLREAGDRATGLDAHAAAARFYSGALELMPEDDPDRPLVLLRHGRASFFASGEGLDSLTEARDALLARGDPQLAAEADVMLYALHSTQGLREPAVTHLEHATELMRDAPPSRAKTYVLSNLARFLLLGGDQDEAIRVGQDAVAMADQLGLDDLRAQILTNLGAARVTAGDPAGLKDLEQGVATAVAASSMETVRAYRILGAMYSLLGNLERSFHFFAEGRRAAERLGDAVNARWLSMAHSIELYWSGNWDDALRRADETIDESRTSPHYLEIVARYVRGQIRLTRGDRAGAVEDAAAGLEFARRTEDEWLVNLALGFAARAHEAGSDEVAAAALAEELTRIWVGGPRSALAAYWVVDLAVAMSGLGREREFLDAAGRATAPTRWLEAATALAAGEAARAAELFGEIGSLPDEAYARLAAGRSLYMSGDPEEAAAELEQARSLFRALGASEYLAEAEQLTSRVD